MTRPLALLAALLSCPLACLAQAPDPAELRPPERPAALFATVGEQRQRVVGFEGAVPLVVISGSRVQAHDSPVLIGMDSAFGSGVVTIDRHPSGAGVMDFFAAYGALGLAENAHLAASFTPDRDLKDAFVALLSYEVTDSAQPTMPRLAVVGLGLGDLSAGKPVEVNLRPPAISSVHQVVWTALVFSEGRLVHTSDGNLAVDHLFDEIDRAGWRSAIAQRLTGSYPPKVYRGFPIRFSDKTLRRHAGQSVRVRVVVSPSGQFEHAEVEGVPDLAMGEEISGQLAYWLFLPRVVEGTAQPGMIVIPFRF